MSRVNPALYVLTEGERDELFYERLCERLTGLTFSKPDEFRIRPGSNWKTAQAAARFLLERFAKFTDSQEMAVLIAIDNDRAPGHPGGRTYPKPLPAHDRKQEPRFSKLREMVEAKLGVDPSRRPVQAVIAMPVEMIESWLLLLLDPSLTDDELPPFADADSAIAREYHGNHPQPQLKDLCEIERRQRKVDLDRLFFDASDTGDLDRLTEASRSFAIFREEVEVLRTRWNAPDADAS